MKVIIEGSYSFYLGFALAFFANISFLQWEFYAILVPVVFLVGITRDRL